MTKEIVGKMNLHSGASIGLDRKIFFSTVIIPFPISISMRSRDRIGNITSQVPCNYDTTMALFDKEISLNPQLPIYNLPQSFSSGASGEVQHKAGFQEDGGSI
jgi:hypothetical protein